MTKNKQILLGAHVSISGGLHKAIERGESIGCTVIQIFTKSNRQWGAKKLLKQDVDLFKTAFDKSEIQTVVAHATYLINIGSPDSNTAKKSTEALATELSRCEELGIPYLVLHPGSHLGTGEAECLNRIANNLDIALENAPGKTMILLETMAGQGSSVCYKFEHLGSIIKNSKNKKRIGICFDTCHVFAAGYRFDSPSTYKKMWEEFDSHIGLNKLKTIHLNDSKKECGSRVDRHEDILKGKIGKKAFSLLLNDQTFSKIPKILETPKESLDDDARNMETVYKILN